MKTFCLRETEKTTSGLSPQRTRENSRGLPSQRSRENSCWPSSSAVIISERTFSSEHSLSNPSETKSLPTGGPTLLLFLPAPTSQLPLFPHSLWLLPDNWLLAPFLNLYLILFTWGNLGAHAVIKYPETRNMSSPPENLLFLTVAWGKRIKAEKRVELSAVNQGPWRQ